MTRAMRALVDGLPVETISIDDRGLQYGHGMFETCRIVDGRIPLWRFHRARLSSAATRLRIPLDVASIDADATQLAAGQSDTDGRLIEGIATIVFLFRDGRIVTPDVSRCGVAGVMRQLLLEQRPGIDVPVETRDVAIEELDASEECSLTNAVIGVWPIARILDHDRARLRPGRISRGIIDALEARFGFPRSQ